ncbi:MAG: CBS domain-containing protein [Deltaproteobacteria bacterium]|jgi:CBS domain-containing protein|nr:CBS domain-containing protein [Deltaproteobacteria bacterium]
MNPLPRTVAEVMTRHVTVLHEEDNLEDLERWMSRLRFRHLPVVDGERLVGLVTHGDLLRMASSSLAAQPAEAEHQRQEATFVARVMQRDVRTVSPDTPLVDAARALIDAKIGCLPVVEDGRLVGIVTAQDFVALTARLLAEREEAPAP